jgi:hypothetical protein
MKTFLSTTPPILHHVRKKRPTKSVTIVIHRIAHNLFNQLSIINLCIFKLSRSLENSVAPGISDDVEKLQRAVQEAAIIAEQLSQLVVEAAPLAEPKTPLIVTSQPQANNVLPLLGPARK